MNAQPGFPVALADRLARPLRDLRLSVIEACNFRCGYCMPADRIPDDYGLDAAGRLSFDQIETLARVAAGLGATKLRIHGQDVPVRAEPHLGAPALSSNRSVRAEVAIGPLGDGFVLEQVDGQGEGEWNVRKPAVAVQHRIPASHQCPDPGNGSHRDPAGGVTGDHAIHSIRRTVAYSSPPISAPIAVPL